MRSIIKLMLPLPWLLVCYFISFSYALSADANTTQGKVSGGIAYSTPDWFKESFLDIKEDVTEAEQANKHVMLFFHLENCPYCAQMLEDSFNKEPLKSYIQTHFDVIAINIRGDREVALTEDQSLLEKELAKELKIQYTPTILFLDAANKPIQRLNGYRSPEQFEPILKFVAHKAYQSQTLTEYLDKNATQTLYEFKDNGLFQAITDFSTVKTPLAVVFEDQRCKDCEYLHTKLLTREDVLQEFKAFTVVRLDANSSDEIIDIDGNKTTPKTWAETLSLDYRPGMVLFDQGKEVTRMDGLLYGYHFRELLRYVSSKAYESLGFHPYLGKRQAELLEQGININMSE